MNENIPFYISSLFIVLTLALFYFFMNGFKYALSRVDYPKRKKRRIFLIVPSGIFIWLVLLAMLSFNDFFQDFQSLPPRILLAVAPPFILILVSIFSGSLDKLLLKIRPWWLINLQTFRVVVEIILWLLFINELIPVQMSFEGWNFDVLVGLTAIPVSYLCFKRRKFFYNPVIAWNIVGLILLFNIIIISSISTPSPLRVFVNEPSNTIVAYYPFIWLPGFVVPMALLLHLASLRQIWLKNRPIEMDF